jgi:two-component system NtrC family sensor kinase
MLPEFPTSPPALLPQRGEGSCVSLMGDFHGNAASQSVPAAGERARDWQADPRFIRYLIVGIVGINVLVAAALAYVFADSRRSEELKFRAAATNVTRLISKDVDSLYGRIDLSLRAVADEYAGQLALGSQQLERWIARVSDRHPPVSFIWISDADGRIIHSPSENLQGDVNISDRAYFIRLRDDPQLELAISPPLTGRISGKTVLAMARRLGAKGSRFSGAAVASVPVADIEGLLRGLRSGAESYIGLLDAELRWVAAAPGLPAAATPGTALNNAALRDAVSAASVGAVVMPSEDGSEQLLTYARSASYGFTAVLGQPATVPFADWWRKVVAGSLALALFALLTTLLGWLLRRSWKQQSATTASLIERDEWVRQAQKVGGLALFSYDIASGRFVVSDALYAITGTDIAYPHTWPGWLALVHPDDREVLDLAFRQVVAAGLEVPGVAYRIIRPVDGSVRWVESVAHLVVAPDGASQTVTGVVVDVTAQKRDEDALRKSEQLFRGVFENSMIGIATTTPDRQWLEVNQALCDFFAYKRDELLSKDWLELTYPDDRAASCRLLERAIAGEIDSFEVEKRYLRSDGTIITAHVSAHALRRADGSIEHFITMVQDSTARKRAEAGLRQSEADLRTIFEQAAVGIALVAPDGTWLRVNQALCALLGYPREELVGRTFQEMTHEDDVEPCFELFARLLAGKIDLSQHEKRYFHSDGRTVWANVTLSLVCHDDGTPRHFVAIIEGVDARREAEREVRRSREFLLSFLDHLPGLAYVKDSSRRLLLANRGFIERIERDAEALIGRSNAELYPGDFAEKVDAEDRRVLASGVAEVIVETYAGSVYRTTKFAIPQDDGPALLGGISLDISRSFRLDQRTKALLEINALAGSLVEKAFLAHALELAERLTDSSIGFLHFVNDDQESIELSTWTGGALKGCTALFDSHYPLSTAGIWADCCREKRAVTFNDYGEYAAKRGLPEGHAPLQRLISVPVIEDGLVRMVLGVGNKPASYDDLDLETVQLIGNEIWSVVRRVRSEAALARRLAEVIELKDKLEDAHLQLLQSEKMSAIGQLAAGVAHELNNPIGFVHSNLGTLGEYVEDLLAIDAAYARVEEQLPALAGPGALDEVHRLKAASDHSYVVEDLPKLIRESKEGLERVHRIVLDLRDFSRVGESEWQWTDLEKGLESTINIVWNELKYKAEVERQYTPLPPIHCLASQLNQVFMNLLVNAAQAIETSGRIVIRTGTEAASTDAASAVDVVWVEIEDSGCGMSPEVQKRLFEPFFTTKPVGKGTGLGLSIAFAIIARHHGRIDVHSEVGCGTTFRITLPIDPSHAETGTEC